MVTDGPVSAGAHCELGAVACSPGSLRPCCRRRTTRGTILDVRQCHLPLPPHAITMSAVPLLIDYFEPVAKPIAPWGGIHHGCGWRSGGCKNSELR